MTLATPPFEQFLRVICQAVPENMRVKFEVSSFNRFGAITISI